MILVIVQLSTREPKQGKTAAQYEAELRAALERKLPFGIAIPRPRKRS